MQPAPTRHWFRTLLPAGASCPAAEFDRRPTGTLLQQVATTYTAGLVAALAFIA